MRIAARYANEWSVRGPPDVLAQKGEVLDRHCADLGRDSSQITRSANAPLVLSDDRDLVLRARESGRATVTGSVQRVKEVVQQYVDAGVGELIIPDFSLDRYISTAHGHLRALHHRGGAGVLVAPRPRLDRTGRRALEEPWRPPGREI